jgi:hypothetical protein
LEPSAPRLAAYRTAGQPGEFHGTVGTTTVGDCSAHWFTVKGNLVALGNYEQGTRILDISGPTNPQQVGWYRVPARTADPSGKPDIISSVRRRATDDSPIPISTTARHRRREVPQGQRKPTPRHAGTRAPTTRPIELETNADGGVAPCR